MNREIVALFTIISMEHVKSLLGEEKKTEGCVELVRRGMDVQK